MLQWFGKSIQGRGVEDLFNLVIFFYFDVLHFKDKFGEVGVYQYYSLFQVASGGEWENYIIYKHHAEYFK